MLNILCILLPKLVRTRLYISGIKLLFFLFSLSVVECLHQHSVAFVEARAFLVCGDLHKLPEPSLFLHSQRRACLAPAVRGNEPTEAQLASQQRSRYEDWVTVVERPNSLVRVLTACAVQAQPIANVCFKEKSWAALQCARLSVLTAAHTLRRSVVVCLVTLWPVYSSVHACFSQRTGVALTAANSHRRQPRQMSPSWLSHGNLSVLETQIEQGSEQNIIKLN